MSNALRTAPSILYDEVEIVPRDLRRRLGTILQQLEDVGRDIDTATGGQYGVTRSFSDSASRIRMIVDLLGITLEAPVTESAAQSRIMNAAVPTSEAQ